MENTPQDTARGRGNDPGGTGVAKSMIEALKDDAIVQKMGGRFKLCALIQRRLLQLMEGARPLVDRAGRTDLEIVIEEIMQNKISYEFDPTTEADYKAALPPRSH